MRGTAGNHCFSTFRPRYSARKSWPHCDTQCASSIATIATETSRKQIARLVLEQALGREVQQLQLAVAQSGDDFRLLGAPQRRIQERRSDAGLAQRADLVLHQRDQRRDDDADAVAHESRNLIAQRLAAARRHQHERVLPRHGGSDDRFLLAAKIGVAEHVAQQRSRAWIRSRCGCAQFGNAALHSRHHAIRALATRYNDASQFGHFIEQSAFTFGCCCRPARARCSRHNLRASVIDLS